MHYEKYLFGKHLLMHLLRSNREQILARSLMHCHLRNVHSIMLLECPGKTIRLFVAEPGHELYGNTPDMYEIRQTVGFHAHHCEIMLVPTRGTILNWIVRRREVATGFPVKVFKYRSAITHGAIGFERIGNDMLESVERELLKEGDHRYMSAQEMHTVAAPRDQWASWFVFEGREEVNNDTRCWSTADLDRENFSGLYQPMSEQQLEWLLREAFKS